MVDPKLKQEVVMELAIRKYVEKNQSVKQKQLRHLASRAELRRVFEHLEETGAVEQWTENTGTSAWTITL